MLIVMVPLNLIRVYVAIVLLKRPARLPRRVGCTRVMPARTRLVQTAGLNGCEMDMVERIENKVALL